MYQFVIDTLKPEVFWNAVSAIGTLSAVIIALFLPTYIAKKKYRNILILINNEIAECINWIERSDMLEGLPEEYKPSAKIEHLKKLDISIWQHHKKEFSLENPNIFLKYEKLYSLIGSIKEFSKTPDIAKLYIVEQEIGLLKKEYRSAFKQKKWYQNT